MADKHISVPYDVGDQVYVDLRELGFILGQTSMKGTVIEVSRRYALPNAFGEIHTYVTVMLENAMEFTFADYQWSKILSDFPITPIPTQL